MLLDYSVVKFEDLKLSKAYATKIRGYFGNKYSQYEILHNHKDDGYVFKYPKVQYKIIGDKSLICGIQEGSTIVSQLGIVEDEIVIDDKVIELIQKRIIREKKEFGISDDYIEYRFVTPWMALNQKNIERYNQSSSIEKEDFLKRILTGNIMSMSKGLGYTVPDKIHVWLDLTEVPVRLKGVNMKGFKGNFKVNFKIPEYLGLGKSVSRGFGSVERMDKLFQKHK